VSEFHAEAPQATASEGIAQIPYVAGTSFQFLGVKFQKQKNSPKNLDFVDF